MPLYHRVPPKLFGTILYPLNSLREDYPLLYEQYVAEYAGREQLLKERIPPLDCLWNDVLFLSAVDPRKIRRACEEAGAELPPRLLFFEIEPIAIDPRNAVVWTRSKSPDDFQPFEPQQLEAYAELPEKQIRYYREEAECNRSPLLWMHLTQILYKGAIDISNTRVLEV
ncbi:MAG TPA: hypothetical protein VHB93_01345 [Candidatus Paceibacterota bacterium]|nr:hypothetical protein [Candidatus Paceibacterota bacterium]